MKLELLLDDWRLSPVQSTHLLRLFLSFFLRCNSFLLCYPLLLASLLCLFWYVLRFFFPNFFVLRFCFDYFVSFYLCLGTL
ncbi:uncharacterized protein DS421_19g660440 [Arachis hypogaea]|uniref:Uncharacterized protein n=1 Tax=Arachis hypogaea TaxID=3818 RepID=A0A6B9VA09_ARAHY|nr:uncharacterized protein DS421_19g660440 [Arachis hypogaea]